MTSLFEKIIIAVFYLLLILVIIQVLLKITGHSPITEILLSSTLSLVILYIVFATNKFYNFMGQMTEFRATTKESFRIVKIDINRINDKLDFIVDKINKVAK